MPHARAVQKGQLGTARREKGQTTMHRTSCREALGHRHAAYAEPARAWTGLENACLHVTAGSRTVQQKPLGTE